MVPTENEPAQQTGANGGQRRRTPLPGRDGLLAELRELATKAEPIARYRDAVRTGQFVHPDGRTDSLETVVVLEAEAALLSYLARRCPTPLSVEIGFGMGSSSTVILATRDFYGHTFEHYVYDPFGLGSERGTVVEAYLNELFEGRFHRVWERSEIGLGDLLKERGFGSAGLIFIDGAHRFEHVMTDFLLADHLCCEGGFIVFDDGWFPAIEAVINYIALNRPDYAVHHLIVENTSLIQKVSTEPPEWDSFKPFPVPRRENWTPKHGPQWRRPAPG